MDPKLNDGEATSDRATFLPGQLNSISEEVQLFTSVTSRLPTKGAFFGSLRLSQTGGISEVGGLFKPTRYFGAVVFLVLLVANTHNLIRNDVRGLLAEDALHVELQWHHEGGHFKEVFAEAQLLPHEVYLFRVFGATPEFLVAMFELVCLVYHVVRVLGNLVYAKYTRAFHPQASPEHLAYYRWNAIARIFRAELPFLQAFSAMRTLQYVTPGVLTPQVQRMILRLQREGARSFKKLLRVAWFFGLHLLYAFFGAEAFLVKFRIVASEMTRASDNPRTLFQIFLFLNQMLGIVQLNMYTHDRLFFFIFGGVDSYVDKSERKRMRVWNAAFEKSVWDSFENTPGRFLAVSLTFSDLDFQRMVLDESEP
mmetsp:Transcript_142021/g.441605  ORF Transcript_142021/g.441605 Transcript_142021/m.441605 type:complete len:367 (+) Transcript_142021:25-1125(+)